MITAGIYELCALLATIAFIVLVVVAIGAIVRLRNTLREAEEFLAEGKKTLAGLNGLVGKVNDASGDIGELSARLRDTGTKAIDLVDAVIDRLRSPILALISVIAGLDFGFKHCKQKAGDKQEGGGNNDTHE